jgi:hypothetical protein
MLSLYYVIKSLKSSGLIIVIIKGIIIGIIRILKGFKYIAVNVINVIIIESNRAGNSFINYNDINRYNNNMK